VGERAASLFPFGIAIVLPPAGLLLGLLNMQQENRELGIRLILVSLLSAVVWVLLFVG
jgi:4-amino-4-deoxy-L-arabinose transferase-like glycosyltransferase